MELEYPPDLKPKSLETTVLLSFRVVLGKVKLLCAHAIQNNFPSCLWLSSCILYESLNQIFFSWSFSLLVYWLALVKRIHFDFMDILQKQCQNIEET